ncbi:MAG: sugar ABC transporter permease [Firmicutes bacterium]|nr:sugar ABC transporter permease [Bacillota bacterium]
MLESQIQKKIKKIENRRCIAAILSTVFMGAGQIANGQFIKGFFFIIFNAFVIINSIPYFLRSFQGLVTLGETPMKDHSLFFMVYGIIALLLLLVILAIYLFNIRDAYKNGKLLDNGQKPARFYISLKKIIEGGYPYIVLSPGLIVITAITILPMIFSMLIAFTNYDLYHSPPKHILDWVGIKNFYKVLTLGSWSKTFRNIFGWTVIWSILSTVTTFGLGGFLAILLNNPRIKFRKIIRTLLILPWAIPAFVSILIWRGMLNTNFGIINKFLVQLFNINNIPWLYEVFWARVALILVNLWLGFPYAMILITGILQSIPSTLYEAATVDGASGWQKFRTITLPLLLYSMAPLLIMTFAYNFNNFNIIYLLNDGGPAVFGWQGGAGGTDILISWIFKLTFQKLKYNYASAISIIIFIIIAGFSIYNFRRTRSFQEEEMLQ